MSNLLEKLREETRDLHIALHVHPVLKLCQQQQMNKESYIRLLKAFYSPWKLIVPSISSFPIEALRPKLLLRAEAIQDDLLNLNVDITVFSAINEKMLDEQELLGMAYVVVGSSMGASMLSASILASLGNVPISYLSMTPKKAGWPELSATLRNNNTADHSVATSAAVSTFSLIQTQLSKPAF